MATKHNIVLLLVASLILTCSTTSPSPPRIVKQPAPDELLFQVKSDSSENDKPFVIECEAEAEPAPKYRWIKNGKHFDWQAYDDRMSQQPGRGTLVVTSPRNEDLGQYQCFAENEWGIASSNSVFVRKAELNSFKDEAPIPVEAHEGAPFKLTCQPPDGWPKPNVYWLIQNTNGQIKSINNSRMTLDPEGNLWFSNVTREDKSVASMYACSATSVFRNEYKLGNKVVLNVIPTSGVSSSLNRHEPIKQYVTRKNEIALRGQKIEMFCIYGGTPLPQIVWSKDGTAIRASDRLTQGNYGKSLVIEHVNFDDQGSYTCEASNGVGTAKSYSINLEVLAIPYFTHEPEFKTKAEDEEVVIRCEASGVPEPQIKWIHNGKPIAEAPPNPRRKVSANKIVISNLVKGDTGNYGCNATNSLGYVYKDIYVNVLALAPEISEAPKKLLATVDGGDVTLKCRVFGAPTPTVKWLRAGQELTGGRYKVLALGDLFIKSVAFGDAGEYVCFAANKFGTAEATGNLVVKEHTRITDAPENYEVYAKKQAIFRCNAVTDPSLKLEISWLINNQPIDFLTEPRYVRSSDFSLTITSTTELDSGEYTCVARTELDNATAQATLTVQDKPNPPQLLNIDCQRHMAQIHWTPMGDNRAPILYYIIQYNTSFTPQKWDEVPQTVPATETTFNVEMSPWTNYTFRVVAVNKVDPSLPSEHSAVCTTQPEVPHKNPDNVKGEGTDPTNLVISWTAMPEIEHNGPKFQYRIQWKENTKGLEKWFSEIIKDPKQDSFIVLNQPTFVEYTIRVIALNDVGEADVAVRDVIGYSGEAVPTHPPTNFTLVQVHSATTAMLEWNPVPPETVKGHFKGYKIQTWTDGDSTQREIQVKDNVHRALFAKFIPHTKNYVRVLVFNGRYNGPPSEVLNFDTPEGVPGPVDSLEAYQMGSSALYLVWKKPKQPNGIITGYKIFYSTVIGRDVENKIARLPQIKDPNQRHAKLGNLEPGSKYRIYILATTKMGDGDEYYIETETRADGAIYPDKPRFNCSRVASGNGLANIKCFWIVPAMENSKPGSHFFVKYKVKGTTIYETTQHEENEDFIEVRGLPPDQAYEFKVVAVDGELMTESDPQAIDTYGMDGPIIRPKENVATAGWFIGMMLAIAFLLLVLIIVCIVKRNRGGKYAVHEREQANGRHDYPDEGGFHEYSQPLDNKSHGRTSMSSEPKQAPESDTDSMAEYGEGDTEGMNEDGSFIGQYGRQRKQGETSSQGFATLV